MMRAQRSVMQLGLALVISACANADEIHSPIEAIIHDEVNVDPGYLFWHQSDELQQDVENVSVLIDSRGRLVHTWPTTLTGGGTPAYLLEDGRVLRTGIQDRRNVIGGPVAATDVVQIVDKHGNVAWEFAATQLENTLFHHDMEPMQNGDILISTYKRIAAEDALKIGWDPGNQAVVWADGLIQVSPNYETGDAEIVWRWSFADHLIQDRFPDAPNYGAISEHPERVDPHFPKSYAPRNAIRQHVNSVDYNEQTDQILISSFIYNEIWIIERSGEIVFRYGNPAAYGMGTVRDRAFLKQHDANWIDAGLPGAGNILVHNNNTVIRPRAIGQQPSGNMRDIDVDQTRSNVFELSLPVDADGKFARPANGPFEATIAWYWEHPEYFADFQGGARRLPNGNTLISDTTDYLVVEVNNAGDIVAQYQGTTPVFKAFKYSAEMVAPLVSDKD